MSNNKKYYYLKFKESYFEQDYVKVIEAMTNGYEYSLIILKLYLKSLKYEGQLKINERIPYSKDKIELLAGVLNHKPESVMHAINLAIDLGIMQVFDTGEMFMLDIQNFIGHSSTEADRKKRYREKIKGIENKQLEENGTKTGQCPDKRPPELELELELDLEIEKEIDLKLDLKKEKEKEKKNADIKSANKNPSLFTQLKNAYNQFLLDNDYIQEIINDTIYKTPPGKSGNKELKNMRELFNKFDSIDKFKAFLKKIKEFEWLNDKPLLPSMLNSMYEKIMFHRPGKSPPPKEKPLWIRQKEEEAKKKEIQEYAREQQLIREADEELKKMEMEER
jgi:predicted phage replisome organizer